MTTDRAVVSGGSRVEPAIGAVLAGGDSRRMGRDKALLVWRGQTLLERAITVLRSVVPEVVIAAGSRHGYDRFGCPVVPDAEPGLGPLGGLAGVMKRYPGRDVFLLACDLPLVSVELLRFLLAETGVTPGGVVPAQNSKVQPLCGVYRADSAAELKRFLDQGERRAVLFVGEIGARLVEIGPELPFYRSDLLVNLNRSEDVDHLEDTTDLESVGSVNESA